MTIKRRRVGLFAIVAALALLSSACGSIETAPTMQVKVIDGSARIVRDGKSLTIRSFAQVKAGDRLILGRGAVSEVRLAVGRVLELAEADVEILGTDSVRLFRGDLLADAAARLMVDGETFTVKATHSAFRVERSLSSRVGVYAGQVRLSSPGQELRVSKYRQAIVAGGELPGRESPLRISTNDRWDRRFLQEAMDLNSRLANFGHGLELQLIRIPQSGLFSRIFNGGADPDFLAAYGQNRRSDVLIGLAIAWESTNSGTSPVSSQFDKVFELWTEGGSWGLIAHELNVVERSLFDRLVGWIRILPVSLGRQSSSLGQGQAGPRPAASPTNGSSPSPTQSPSPSPSPSNSPVTGVDEVDDIINEAIETLPTL